MTPCPSDENLTALLADSLGVADRDGLVKHVEGCPACQERLARLSEPVDEPVRTATELSVRERGQVQLYATRARNSAS